MQGVGSIYLDTNVFIAASLIVGCAHLLSHDNRIGPRAQQQLAIEALHPDEPTLTSLIESLSA